MIPNSSRQHVEVFLDKLLTHLPLMSLVYLLYLPIKSLHECVTAACCVNNINAVQLNLAEMTKNSKSVFFTWHDMLHHLLNIHPTPCMI